MKKALYVDLRNQDQVKWWNDIGQDLVRVIGCTEVLETATGSLVGYILHLTEGIMNNFVVDAMNDFIDEPVQL